MGLDHSRGVISRTVDVTAYFSRWKRPPLPLLTLRPRFHAFFSSLLFLLLCLAKPLRERGSSCHLVGSAVALRSDGVITTRARAERRPFFRRRPAAERAWFLASHYRGAIPIVRRFCPFRQADRFCPVLAFVRRDGSRF